MEFLTRHRTPLLIAGGTLLLVLIAFGRTLTQGFAPLDDLYLIVQNLAVVGTWRESLTLSFGTYDPELYIPLTLLSFRLNFLLGGIHPFSYHLLNILLHAGNALLVMAILTKMTKNRIAGIIAGLLFAVHPIHSEAVAWIAGRKDLLSTFFVLFSLWGYLSYREKNFYAEAEGSVRHGPPSPLGYGGQGVKEELPPHDRSERGLAATVRGNTGFGIFAYYILSLLFFLFSLLAKVMTVTLPVLLMLHDVLIERRSWKKSLIDKIPFFALSGIFLIIASLGKERVLGNTGILETILMTGKSTMFYCQKFFFPTGLSIFYPYRGPISLTEPAFILSSLFFLLLLGIIVWTWKRRPAIAFGLSFFLIALSPTFPHFRRAGEVFVAVDRYAYFPSLGLFLVLALIAAWMFEQRKTLALWTGTIILIFALTALSARQARVWDSPQSLFTHALSLYPASTEARVSLARWKRQEKKFQEAFDLLQAGIRLTNDMALHLQLGSLYAETGNVTEARGEFTSQMAAHPKNPDPVFALASLERQLGNADEALRLYRRVVDLDPSFVIARVHLAHLLRQKNDQDGAATELTEALRWNRTSIEANLEYADLLLEQRKIDEALAHLQTVLKIDPKNSAATSLFRTIKAE